MAEQEVVKHTEKVYKIWSKKEHSFWHKAKEFLIEILIIIFAVSVSIWFHERSEHSHQQKEVKIFLTGLRGDLVNDVNEMKVDKGSYDSSRVAFAYVRSVKINQPINIDSLKKYGQWLFNTTRLLSNSGRYQGFKASGKLGNIEDIGLQNAIIDLYEEDIPNLLLSSDVYTDRKSKLLEIYVRDATRTSDSTSDMMKVLKSDEVFNIASGLIGIGEIITRYDICIDRATTIISEIDKLYGKE
jgi:hypothetical protein